MLIASSKKFSYRGSTYKALLTTYSEDKRRVVEIYDFEGWEDSPGLERFHSYVSTWDPAPGTLESFALAQLAFALLASDPNYELVEDGFNSGEIKETLEYRSGYRVCGDLLFYVGEPAYGTHDVRPASYLTA